MSRYVAKSVYPRKAKTTNDSGWICVSELCYDFKDFATILLRFTIVNLQICNSLDVRAFNIAILI